MEEEEEDEGEGQLLGERSSPALATSHASAPYGFLTFPLCDHPNQLLANLSLLTLNDCKLLVVAPSTLDSEKK